MAPPPPVIEGTLKSTINSLGFGLIVTVLSVNFGKLFLRNFFVYIVAFVITIEVILFSLYKPRRDYEVYRPPGRRGTQYVGGEIQIVEDGQAGDETSSSPRKRRLMVKGREKDRLIKKEMKEHQRRRESSMDVSPTSLQVPAAGTSLERAESFGKIDKDAEKARKEQEKAEKKAADKAKEGSKGGWRKKH